MFSTVYNLIPLFLSSICFLFNLFHCLNRFLGVTNSPVITATQCLSKCHCQSSTFSLAAASVTLIFGESDVLSAVLLTCQSEQRGLAKAVSVSVFEQVETGQCGVQEEAGLCVGLQRVIAGDPGVPVEDEGGSIPECLILLPLGQPHLAAGAHIQEVVRSVGCLKGNP